MHPPPQQQPPMIVTETPAKPVCPKTLALEQKIGALGALDSAVVEAATALKHVRASITKLLKKHGLE